MMQMFRARCRDCQWEFDVVALPMPISKAAEAMGKACCPMCGNRAGNVVAPSRPLTDLERAHKTSLPFSKTEAT